MYETATYTTFCSRCASVDLLRAMKNREQIRHHDSYEALEDAAFRGCRLCSVFRQVLIVEQSRKCRQTVLRAVAALQQASGPALWVSVSNGGGTLIWRDEFGAIKNGRYRRPTFSVYRTSAYVEWPGDPPLDRRLVKAWPNLELCKTWIDSCATVHKDCDPLSNRRLPTRIIDISSDSASFQLKLVETAGACGQYITLSHCWGTGRRFMTTTNNYLAHLDAIRYEDLPLTFQHAVKITAMLGFRYLWIDSICIIQGDKDDWQRECAQMAQTYECSTVTIAGPASSSAEGGLIHVRPVRPSCEVPIYDASGDTTGTLAVALDQDLTPFVLERNSPLAERAWVLQERLLSPRVLYFGSRQLYLECNTSTRFEAYHNGSRDVHLSHERTHVTTESALQIIPKGIFGMLQRNTLQYEPYYWWKVIVGTYAHCKLTNGRDKLPALSGIARKFSTLTEDDYLAGLWRNDVRLGLLWQSELQRPAGRERRSLQPARNVAPSWSWASSDYKVYHDLEVQDCGGLYGPLPFGYLDHPFVVVTAGVTRDSADKFGEVTSGSIVVRAPLKMSVIQRNGEEYRGRRDLPIFLCRSATDDTPVAEFVPDEPSWLDHVAGHRSEIHALFVQSSLFFRFIALALVLVTDSSDERSFRRIGRLNQPSDHPIQPRGFDLLDNDGDWFHNAPIQTVRLV